MTQQRRMVIRILAVVISLLTLTSCRPQPRNGLLIDSGSATPTDKGVPLKRGEPLGQGTVIGAAEGQRALWVTAPASVHQGLVLSTATIDAVISPTGDHVVVAEEIPNTYDTGTVAEIVLIDLATGRRITLFPRMSGLYPMMGVQWLPDGKHLWLVNGAGARDLSQGSSGSPSIRLVDLGGETRTIPFELEQGQSLKEVTVSPIDGSLILGIGQCVDRPDGLVPIVLQAFAIDGTIGREYAAGWVRNYNKPSGWPSVTFSPDGKVAYQQNGFLPDANQTMQPVTIEVDLAHGKTKPKGNHINILYSPTGQTFVATTPATSSYAVYGNDGNKLAEIGTIPGDVTWSPDGQRLAYLDDDNRLIVHDCTTHQSTAWLDKPLRLILGWTKDGILVLPSVGD